VRRRQTLRTTTIFLEKKKGGSKEYKKRANFPCPRSASEKKKKKESIRRDTLELKGQWRARKKKKKTGSKGKGENALNEAKLKKEGANEAIRCSARQIEEKGFHDFNGRPGWRGRKRENLRGYKERQEKKGICARGLKGAKKECSEGRRERG